MRGALTGDLPAAVDRGRGRGGPPRVDGAHLAAQPLGVALRGPSCLRYRREDDTLCRLACVVGRGLSLGGTFTYSVCCRLRRGGGALFGITLILKRRRGQRRLRVISRRVDGGATPFLYPPHFVAQRVVCVVPLRPFLMCRFRDALRRLCSLGPQRRGHACDLGVGDRRSARVH